MQRFARLHEQLDAGLSDHDKLALLVHHFAALPAADAAWTLQFLLGWRPRRMLPPAALRATVCRRAGIDDWLFEAAQRAAGDLAETLAHLLPAPPAGGQPGLADWMQQRLLPLGECDAPTRARLAGEMLEELDPPGRHVFVKLACGGLRLDVSRLLVQRALVAFSGLDSALLAQRLAHWPTADAPPDAARWAALLAAPPAAGPDPGRPFAFVEAKTLDGPPQALGEVCAWQVEWMSDGPRVQVVRRRGGCWIWSRDEELVTGRFPEIAAAAARLPEGTVLDGELRAGRPVRLLAFDLLEHGGRDLRGQPLRARRAALQALLDTLPPGAAIAITPRLPAADWADLAALQAAARPQGFAGLVLRALDGLGGGPGGPAAWAWPLPPLRVHAVLLYVQAGAGGAGQPTDCSFAVWSRVPADAAEAQAVALAIERREPARPGALQLLPLAKVCATLAEADGALLDRVVREHTLQRFGPVRALRPTLLGTIGFDAVAASARRRSGLVLRQARVLGWRPDLALHEAGNLPALQRLLPAAVAE